MDARDVALQHSAPVVTVPRYGGFTPLAENGHRFLVTGDGLWLEARRPWMYLRVPLVCQKSPAQAELLARPRKKFEQAIDARVFAVA